MPQPLHFLLPSTYLITHSLLASSIYKSSLVIMAASSAMQSILASPLTRVVSNRSTRVNQFLIIPTSYVSPVPRNASMRVRCIAKKEQPESVTTSTPKVSTNFLDLFAFSGPAPERINGRLAMIGFVAAMVVELSSGEDVFAQISNGGIPWFLGTSIVLSLASLIPLFKGISVESKSEGVMTSDAEMWNGRFAMLGLVALALTEYVKGGTLI
ncbi:early light-induced protein, chloroplastic-like [Quercus robur]|uniref:early light-induced protein, chloroplastic-like n=1 Tax=Quercus robur TaxID=38942 RepID=UPI002161714F|nr:early light-induced protein, chloroplastic-like [Quercus robur]